MLLSKAFEICAYIEKYFSERDGFEIIRTGEVRRCLETIETIEFVAISENVAEFQSILKNAEEITVLDSESGPFMIRAHYEGVYPILFHLATPEEKEFKLFKTTASANHLAWLLSKGINPNKEARAKDFTELNFYVNKFGKNIAPELREGMLEDQNIDENDLITSGQLKGILHNHSTYSDGANTLREMAEAVKNMGYEYFGIADHSRSAFFYANGLYEERVFKQHEEIDKLNAELAPFKIFKGIESDILTDGDLDYSPDILETFDYIVASVHGGLNMDINKATDRLLKAIRNPYTTIMGHLTGRLLLARKGYPVDHKTIIDECAIQNVGIEINAHPIRLDLDWRWVNYAIEKNVMISINPDAHAVDGLDMNYGVLIGRKGGLTAKHTLNSLNVDELNAYFSNRKSKIKK